MKRLFEAQKIDGVKHPQTEITQVCAACGYDLDEHELVADTCSDCNAPLRLKQSVSIWATSVPKAGATVWGK